MAIGFTPRAAALRMRWPQVCPQDRASQADALLQLPWFTGKEMSEDEEADEPLYSPLYSFDYMLPMAWTPWLA